MGTSGSKHGKTGEKTKDAPVIADMIFYGNILTMDDPPTAEAVAIKEDEIVYVGSSDGVESFKGPETRTRHVWDGETLMPGLIEAHTHSLIGAGEKFFIDLSSFGHETWSWSDVDAKIKDAVQKAESSGDPKQWLLFSGLDAALTSDFPSVLNKEYLDSHYSTQFPILIVAENGHMAWVNQTTFVRCGIEESSEYINYEQGILRETKGISTVLEHLRPESLGKAVEIIEECLKALKENFMHYASKGFTTVTEMCAPGIGDSTLLRSQHLTSAMHFLMRPILEDFASVLSKLVLKDLCVRLGIYFNGGAPDLPNLFPDRLWIAGAKLFADGSPYSGTMAVEEDYLSTPLTKALDFNPDEPKGHLNWKDEDLQQKLTEIHSSPRNWSIAVHSHGDRAIDQMLRNFEAVLKDKENKGDLRYRIDHLGLITEDQVKRAAELGLTVTFYPDHIYFYGEALANSIIGQDRANRFTPVGWGKKYGHKFTLHEDTPCSPVHPFISMQAAVTRQSRAGKEYNLLPKDDLRISVEDALKAYTTHAAWQLKKEDQIGSIRVGKKADLVVLSDDPLKIAPDKLGTIQAVETYLGGTLTYPRETETAKTKE